MKDHLNKNREAIAYYVALIVAAWLVAMITSTVVRSTLTPTVTANERAFRTLVEAGTCGRYAEAQRLADSAYTTANDPDIRKIADYSSRISQLVLSMGVQTREEADSITGLSKAFVTGFVNPLKGVEGVALSIEAKLGDLHGLAERLDTRYRAIFLKSRRAQTAGSMTFWLVLASAGYGYYRYRHQVSGWLRPRIQRLPFICATPTA